jgi:SAM-dependent methyltransferase
VTEPVRFADWDAWWRWEIFRRRVDPIDFRRWKADSSRALRELPEGRDRDGRPPRLLDASCGMGLHALIQHELGFEVEACDASAVALAAARALFDAEGAAIPTFQTRWEELGTLRSGRYDLIFNDEVHQVRPHAALLEVLRGFAGALRPGGSLVFFFADDAKPDDGVNQATWAWEHMERDRHAWTARDGDLEVSLRVEAERAGDDLILEHHHYDIRPDGRPAERETVTLGRSYLWDWDRVLPVLREAGFDAVRCHQCVNVHGRTFTMNLASMPAATTDAPPPGSPPPAR